MKKNNVFIHNSSYVDTGAIINKGTQIWHFSHIMSRAIIGKNCKIGQNVFIGDNVIVGDNVKIQNNVSLYSGVILEDDVFCGPSCVFTNIKKPRSAFPKNNVESYLKTTIKRGATIGANATIVCGITLGCYSFVGAGSVVTKNVDDFAMVLGVPAKIKGWMCKCGEKLMFRKNGRTICKECTREFIKRGKHVKIFS